MKLVDTQRLSLLHQWAEDFIGTPMIKECPPPREKLVEYFTASINYLRSYFLGSKPGMNSFSIRASLDGQVVVFQNKFFDMSSIVDRNGSEPKHPTELSCSAFSSYRRVAVFCV
ncbi:hypothetical protein CRYUN_Cryun12cG0118900 [Craigia yunnanensis]